MSSQQEEDMKPLPELLLTEKQRRKELLEICHSLFPQPWTHRRVSCNLCEKSVNYVLINGRFLNCSRLIDHASVHHRGDPYVCGICGRNYSTVHNVNDHIRRVHWHESGYNNYFDRSLYFHQRTKELIAECFERAKVSAVEPTPKKRPRNIRIARHKTRGSQLTVQRQLVIHRMLLAKKDNAPLRCKLCKRQYFTRKHWRISRAINHALSHLKQPVFTSNICQHSAFNYRSMAQHLRVHHRLGMTKNHTNNGDNFHEDIVDIFERCYGR